MPNALRILFPLAFALLNRLLFTLLHPPPAASAGDVSGWMVFAAALAWSAMIFIRRPELRRAKLALAAAGTIGAFVLAGFSRALPDERFWHQAMAVFVLLGVAGIQLYLSILRRGKAN